MRNRSRWRQTTPTLSRTGNSRGGRSAAAPSGPSWLFEDVTSSASSWDLARVWSPAGHCGANEIRQHNTGRFARGAIFATAYILRSRIWMEDGPEDRVAVVPFWIWTNAEGFCVKRKSRRGKIWTVCAFEIWILDRFGRDYFGVFKTLYYFLYVVAGVVRMKMSWKIYSQFSKWKCDRFESE